MARTRPTSRATRHLERAEQLSERADAADSPAAGEEHALRCLLHTMAAAEELLIAGGGSARLASAAADTGEAGEALIRLYHRTSVAGASAILAEGFRDGAGTYLTDREWRGVWLSNDGDGVFIPDAPPVLLAVDLDVGADELAAFEWVEEGRAYREWLVPAAYIRDHAARIAISD